MTTRSRDDLAGFGANERAILERVPGRLLRRAAAGAVRLKMRLQFSGWLQYLIPLPAIVLLTFLGVLALLVPVHWLPGVFLVPAALLLLRIGYDILTVRLGIHPRESRPRRLDHLDEFDLMRARHSCRSFQMRVMEDEDRAALMASVRRHRSIPMLGPAIPRFEYVSGSLTVWPTLNAREFLVAVVPKEYSRAAVIDVGRALQRIVHDATRSGLGTCWIGPGADQESVAEALGDRFDPDADQIICVLAVGYPSRYLPLFLRIFNRQVSGRRHAMDGLFFSDMALEEPIDVAAEPYARFGRTFEVCQWAPSSYNGQTTRGVVEADGASVTAMRFLVTTASQYYAPVALGIWCANWELGCEALGIDGLFALAPQSDDVPHHDVTWRPARMT